MNITAAIFTQQALDCLDQAGLGASPAACHLQNALDVLGYKTSVEDLKAALLRVPEPA